MGASLKIVAMGILAAVIYGELQDNTLIGYCPEYFTVFHPDIFGTHDLRLLALGWGFVATWWVGLLLGIALAACAQGGPRPQVSWRQLLPGICLVFGVTAAITGLVFVGAGAAGFTAPAYALGRAADLDQATQGKVSYMLAAYNASYLTAFLGGVALCIQTWVRRKKLAHP